MLQKPKSKFDLMPAFNRIGDADWDTKLRQILVDYEVPLPAPCSQVELADCEKRLGFALPYSFRLFLNTMGPVDFSGIRVLAPKEVKTAEGFWFASYFSEEDRNRLSGMLEVAEAVSDNIYVVELQSSKCGLCSHDPPGFFEWLPSFDALIQVAVIDLSWGYYGWPDDEIEEMAEQLRAELFPTL
ncbi:MAG TPA: hypothetical protein VF627_14150 [Abditibacterium sp.]|jgi:hypothetical protein